MNRIAQTTSTRTTDATPSTEPLPPAGQAALKRLEQAITRGGAR
ncbi:hypothetical protein [Streptomyces tendae]